MKTKAEQDWRIRAATNSDGPAVATLVAQVLGEYGLAFDPGATDVDLGDIEGHYTDRGGVFELVEDGDSRIVGSVGLYPLDETNAELRKMYLAPAARGHGLGKELLDRMIAAARERGFKRVVLETASVLVEAIALYEAHGFTPCDADHLSARCDQAYERRL